MTDRPYVLYCDSTCDLPSEQLAKMDCTILPLQFELDGKSLTTEEITMAEFYAKMREGAMTRTSQIAVGTYLEAFERELEAGKDIFYLAFSSGLSGSYSSACTAREQLLENYPDRKITIVDSLAAAGGEGLMLIYTERKMREGLSMSELEQWVVDNRQTFCHIFTVDDLKYLFRGGRVSRTAAIAGTMLGIKPILNVDHEGHLIPQAKVRGRKQSIKKMGEMIRERCGDLENKIVVINHADCLEDAHTAEQMMKEIFGEDIEVVMSMLGPVVGAHTGPGLLALFFRGKYR